MHPRSQIQKLNLRRELTRRLKLIKKRVGEIIFEHHYFHGAIQSLPEEMREPPEWARLSANLAWEQGIGAIVRHLTPEEIRRDPRGAIREIMALLECLTAYIDAPDLRMQLAEIGDAELIEAQGMMVNDVAKVLAQHLRRLDERLDELIPPATHQQLIEYRKRSLRTTQALAPEDEMFFGAKTTTGRIGFVIWFMWPEFEAKPKFTAADLHKWLAQNVQLSASDKLVEAVYTKVRLSGRRAS